jgi:hypothetical protein
VTYLAQVLVNLPTTRMSELSAWLPDQWKLAQAARLASLQNQAPMLPRTWGLRNAREMMPGHIVWKDFSTVFAACPDIDLQLST